MFDFSLLISSFPRLLAALPVTLELFAAIVVVGLIVGVPAALVGLSSSRILSGSVKFYIGAFRGTPALVQLFFLYYGFGQFSFIRHSVVWPLLRDPFTCAVIALGLNSGAYTARILMGALSAVPKGIVEAAEALGLSRASILSRVKAPIAIRIALPAYANETILNLKATSLASTVTIMELTGTSKLLVSETYAPYEIFVGAGLVYLAMTFVLSHAFRIIELNIARRTGKNADVVKPRKPKQPAMSKSSDSGDTHAA
ncbi:ABC transporter permease [Caballeronia mineralivorans]|jgi:His/Glu/Gln/Arg/opine family amino acid ABC transporter permease subunit|uniref:ABC transporter permease n=1 Tax=Caballeronia mineralivorans TaxID=2010198 RepID=UPI0023EFA2D7|nr:ABC transporter permease subunit [Caballeronia mineralivorans]MDB5786865.1 Amino acid transporter rane protein 2, family [Caballeronia mineralivorans]MEA3099503.1 putative lysine/arginine/ornithine/histidine/octopine transport system permease protein [Caballeronia mineralivorans]